MIGSPFEFGRISANYIFMVQLTGSWVTQPRVNKHKPRAERCQAQVKFLNWGLDH